MKIVTVVGARPQFIKAAAVSRVIRENIKEILVHTGQHYDKNMSDIFFDELNIPKPDYNLGVGSGSHATQTGNMMIGLEDIFLREKPDYVLVYGDTNSTLAAALAASKILIPVVHVESGLRSFNMAMPEEQNRVLTDHISKILCCPTDTAVKNLANEGITKNVYHTGDVMCDAVRFYLKQVSNNDGYFKGLKPIFNTNIIKNRWYMATVHRAENTDSIDKLRIILNAFEKLDAPVLFPVHPRIRNYIVTLMTEHKYENICFVEPLGYLEMLFFSSRAIKIVTDSGGLQKEAYIMHRNVVTLRNQTEWVETLKENHNILCDINENSILKAIYRDDIQEYFDDTLYGEGNASKKIEHILMSSMLS